MATYLTDQWFDEVTDSLAGRDDGAAAGATGGASDSADGERIVLQQIVTGGPDGEVTYRVDVTGGRVQIMRGPGDADVTITTDYDTAAALHLGRLSLQEAFQGGRVKVGGNVATLVARQAVLTGAGSFATPAATV